MKKKLKQFRHTLAIIAMATFTILTIGVPKTFAIAEGSVGFTLSPLREDIVLNPGDTYRSSFKISCPATQTANIKYEVDVQAFYVDENYNNVFGVASSRNLITDWITIDSPKSGTLSPNDVTEILFTINVPADAPAGGQYADIRVSSASISDGNESGNGAALGEKIAIGHLVYAEVTGKTIRQGEIINVDVPGFILSGDIAGTASIKNTGNVHSRAYYTLKVYPLFSDEEIYTNEEDPASAVILPDRTLLRKTVMDNTPTFGIFNVVYTVEFEGVTEQISKMVIKCPIWLLFIILFIIAVTIIYFVMRAKSRKNSRRRIETE